MFAHSVFPASVFFGGVFPPAAGGGPGPTPQPQTYGGAGPSRKRIKHAVEELRRRRPKPLTHEVALAATVKKVAKKAQIPIHDAQLAVNMAVFQLSEDVSFRLAANLARSHTPTTKADDALIRAFWADVAERAVELDDEEYLFLTML